MGGLGGSRSSSSTTQSPTDPEAARRMAAVEERNVAMAEEQWGIGKELYLPYESKMVKSNMALLDPNRELMEARLKEGVHDIASDRERRDLIREQMTQELKDSAGVPGQFYKESLEGIDEREEIGKARSDVEQAYAGTEGAWRREAARTGIDPKSGRYSSMRGEALRRKASDLAGASNQARWTAERDKYSRLMTAMQMRAGAKAGSIDSSAYRQGQAQTGGYQLGSPFDRSARFLKNAVAADAAGMRPLTQSEASSWSFNANVSSIRYKEDVELLKIAPDALDALNAVVFRYKNGGNERHIGFIAEDVHEVIPEVVAVDEAGSIEGIRYVELIPILVEEIKQLKARVKSMEVRDA